VRRLADQRRGIRLLSTLSAIAQAEADARSHDRSSSGDRERHAEAAQRADEAAEMSRSIARTLIEDAFPGVSWSMIERATL